MLRITNNSFAVLLDSFRRGVHGGLKILQTGMIGDVGKYKYGSQGTRRYKIFDGSLSSESYHNNLLFLTFLDAICCG